MACLNQQRLRLLVLLVALAAAVHPVTASATQGNPGGMCPEGAAHAAPFGACQKPRLEAARTRGTIHVDDDARRRS